MAAATSIPLKGTWTQHPSAASSINIPLISGQDHSFIDHRDDNNHGIEEKARREESGDEVPSHQRSRERQARIQRGAEPASAPPRFVFFYIFFFILTFVLVQPLVL